jgi:hypothetical protein
MVEDMAGDMVDGMGEKGTLMAEGSWKDGRQDGLYKWYYETGKLTWKRGQVFTLDI